MWLKCFLMSILLSPIVGLSKTDLNFSLDYFIHRNVKSICVLTCVNRVWSDKLAKLVFKQLMSVTQVNIDASLHDLNAIDKCLRRKYFLPVGVLLEGECPKFEEVLEFASQNMLLDSTHKWLIINKDKSIRTPKLHLDDDRERDSPLWINKTLGYEDNSIDVINEEIKINNLVELNNFLGHLNLSVDADTTVADRNGFSRYDLHEVYNFGKIQGGHLIINKMGTWNTEKGLDADFNGFKFYRRWDFQQLNMRSSVVIFPETLDPRTTLEVESSPGGPFISKVSGLVVHAVAEIHNIRFNYTRAERWLGDFSETDQSVAATALYLKLQDITPVMRYLKFETHYIDIVQPTVVAIETRYYYRIPTSGFGKFENQFLRPLSTGAWACVFAMVVLCAIVLTLAAKLEHRESWGQFAVFSVIAVFCQQFFEDDVEHFAGRGSSVRKLTIFVTGISCVLIYNYYTSSVVSWLLSGPPPSMNSLEELLDSPLKLIYEDIGYTRSWLKTPSYHFNPRNAKVEEEIKKKKVFNKKKDEPLFVPIEEGIEMVKAGGYAYHTEVNTANMLISRKFTQSELCELGSLQSYARTHLFPAIQKNSPYKEFWNWSLCRLLERGVISRIQKIITSPAVSCEGSSPRALALGGAAPAFMVLAIGYFVATIVMVLERFVSEYKAIVRQDVKGSSMAAKMIIAKDVCIECKLRQNGDCEEIRNL